MRCFVSKFFFLSPILQQSRCKKWMRNGSVTIGHPKAPIFWHKLYPLLAILLQQQRKPSLVHFKSPLSKFHRRFLGLNQKSKSKVYLKYTYSPYILLGIFQYDSIGYWQYHCYNSFRTENCCFGVVWCFQYKSLQCK